MSSKNKSIRKAIYVCSAIFLILVIAILALVKISINANSESPKKIIDIDEKYIAEVDGVIQYPEGYRLLDEIGKEPEIDGFPTSNNVMINRLNNSSSNFEANIKNFYQVDLNDTKFEDITLYNSQTAIISRNNEGGWFLSKNDNITLSIDIDLVSDINSDKSGEYASVGYYADGTFDEIFFGKIGDDFKLDFSVPRDGEYYFYLMNLCAGAQNYREIKIIEGGK